MSTPSRAQPLGECPVKVMQRPCWHVRRQCSVEPLLSSSKARNRDRAVRRENKAALALYARQVPQDRKRGIGQWDGMSNTVFRSLLRNIPGLSDKIDFTPRHPSDFAAAQ
jgi:hypothetical protein